MQEQNYKNHKQVVYSYYLLTGVPILILIGIAAWSVTLDSESAKHWGLLFLLVGWILLTLLFRARGFAIKAQDRAIRAEESLRHYILSGEPIDSRLTLNQIIALRFASDEEVLALAHRAIAENLSSNQIKKEIKNWQPDHHRV
jgi:hypothetical protein